MLKKIIIFLISAAVIAIIAANFLFSCFPDDYSEYVQEYANQYGVEPSLVYAMIKAESNFDCSAASHKGAVGLMQITPDTGKWCAQKMGLDGYSEQKLLVPETNIKIGVWYLSYLCEKMQSDELAVISYNAGINKVKKWINDGIIEPSEIEAETIPYNETKKYLKKVKLFTRAYRLLYHL